jgi:DNA-binding protein HU-beta
MNKSELISQIAEATNTTKKDTEKFVEAYSKVVIENVAKGNQIQLVGFGTYKRNRREERMGRHPKTGEPIKIAASYGVSFKAGKNFKEAVND